MQIFQGDLYLFHETHFQTEPVWETLLSHHVHISIKPMTEYFSIREETLRRLEENLSEIRERFGIETIGIFGSVSRGDDTPESDVDVLYRFADDESVTTDMFLAFADYLETLFERHVELVSIDYIDPYIEPYIREDAIWYPQEAAV